MSEIEGRQLPFKKPPNAPDHAFYDPNFIRERSDDSIWEVTVFFLQHLYLICQDRDTMPSPADVVHKFHAIVEGARASATRQGIHFVAPTLFEAWSLLTWIADSALHKQLPHNHPKRLSIKDEQEFDQLTALVEEAMVLEDHRHSK